MAALVGDSLQVHVLRGEANVGQAAADLVLKLSEEAIRERGRFVVALSGGSLPGIVFPQLRAAVELAARDRRQMVDFRRWWVVFADERCVGLGHKDSNFKLCNEELFCWAPIPANQILPLNPELAGSPSRAARDYETQLRRLFGETPREAEELDFDEDRVKLDLVLLGLGPDGHTCSLFPGDHRTLESEALVAPVVNSPKPPKQRITLTLRVLANARAAVFVAVGAAKAAVVRQVLLPTPPQGRGVAGAARRRAGGRAEAKEASGDGGSDEEDEGPEDNLSLPAAMVSSERVHWFLDQAAAAGLRPQL